MLKLVSRTDRGLGAFDPTKPDFVLIRTIAKRIVNSVMVHKAQTSAGEIIWADADDTVPESHRFILGLTLPDKKTAE